jgi:hypothetical protein
MGLSNDFLKLNWYCLPFIVAAIVFLTTTGFNHQRANLYRAGMMTLLTWWGGLSYLFWATYHPFAYKFHDMLLCLDVALIGTLPLTVGLLTRSKTYTFIAFGLSLVYIFMRWQLTLIVQF